jgi:TolB-like protein/DNA-binding winged helix-turn-helix (wHTH) protein
LRFAWHPGYVPAAINPTDQVIYVPTLAFGRFLLDPKRRLLLADGQPVRLQPRAFDILEFLINARGRAVGRGEVIAHVWLGQIVSEGNLTVQMSNLRRALAEYGAEDLIITANRGYRFVGDVSDVPDPEGAAWAPSLAGATSEFLGAPRQPGANRRRYNAILSFAVLLPLTLAGLLGWRYFFSPVPARPRLSIVVLPFRDDSDDHSADYLADAVTDDLSTDLAHIAGALVIARETADSFKGHAVPIDQIGRTLNVRYALEGSLRAEGVSLHINAQLIDTSSGLQLWAERFDVPRDRLGEARTTVVRHIASILDVRLEAIEATRSAHDRPHNPDALDLFLRARAYYHHHDDLAGVIEAQQMSEQAIAIAPDFVDALVTESQLLIAKATHFKDVGYQADLGRARELLARAEQQAPADAGVLSGQGDLHVIEGDTVSARASYEIALDHDPNYTRAQNGLAACSLRLADYNDALRHIREAMLQDPFGPTVPWRYGMAGMSLFMLGRFSEAQTMLTKALNAEAVAPMPDALGTVEWNTLFLVATYDAVGNRDSALSAYANYAKAWPHRSVWRMLSYLTRAEARAPGAERLALALADSGMRRFADEHHDDGGKPDVSPREGGDFEPTATSLPGGAVVDLAAVRKLVADNPGTTVVDVGRGAAVIHGAVCEPSPTLRETGRAIL